MPLQVTFETSTCQICEGRDLDSCDCDSPYLAAVAGQRR